MNLGDLLHAIMAKFDCDASEAEIDRVYNDGKLSVMIPDECVLFARVDEDGDVRSIETRPTRKLRASGFPFPLRDGAMVFQHAHGVKIALSPNPRQTEEV
ncbi:hypothetical protein [Novipirellula rosea]|uniref:Uncharacterized protein n=1 Tax=Novipirellula rosea TaxID=1031540 RepID=A0ABP8MSI1_9BACT